MPKKVTKEEFVSRESDILNGDYEFIGEYINAKTKTLFKHNVCGYEWEITPSDFHAGKRCPKCAAIIRGKELRLTKEEFCQREDDIQSGEYEFIGEYVGAHSKALFKHNKCGYEWMIKPNNFHTGSRCPKCSGHMKLTKKEFCEREDDIQSGEYEMLGDYVGSLTKTLFRHNKCGYEWMIKPDNFHKGNRCPKCAGNIKLTKEEFCEREKDIVSGEYNMLGNYVNINTKTLFKHNTCGYEWKIAPIIFQRGHRCPQCAGNIRLTKESFCNRESDIKSGEYEMLGEYINSQTKTTFRHNICGYQWKTTTNSFHAGHRCPKCAYSKSSECRTLNKKEFVNREPDLLSGEYIISNKYTNVTTKTLFKHNVCGYEWEITPNGFHRGNRCPKCATIIRSKELRLTKEEFVEREEDIKSGEYSMLGEYKNSYTKTLFRHSACGYEWETTPAHFYSGKRCPKCKQSKGEKRIYNILNLLNIPFESQKRFDTCRYKLLLPFDFYVNNSFLIEYDGKQHFESVDYFGGDKNYKLRQLRDNIKTQWAKDNGIPLVRIPYTEFDNIEQIIKDSIEKYSIKEVG